MSQIQIPNGWVGTDLSDIILSLENGGRPKGGVANITEGVPSIGGEHLKYDGGFNFTNIKFIPEVFFQSLKQGIIKTNDILIVKDGATTGKTSYVNEKFPHKKASVNEHVFILRPKNEILPKFLYYYIRSNFSQSLIEDKKRGVIGGINTKFVNDFPIAYPKDKNIQKKIVQKLDYILGELEEKKKVFFKLKNDSIENISNISYQSALKSAFSGKLTQKIPPKEDGKELLKKILDEITKYRSKNRKDNSSTNISDRELFEIPRNWCWTTLDKICLVITDGSHQTPPRLSEGRPLLSAKNVRDGYLDWKNIQFVSEDDFKKHIERCKPQKRDLLMVCVGATIGRAAIVDTDKDFMLVRSVAVLRPSTFVNPYYLLAYIKINQTQKKLMSKRSTSAQPGLYLSKIKNIPIPLAPLEHQKEIVKKLEEYQNHINNLEKHVTEILDQRKQAEIFFQRVPKKILDIAFSGKLVN